eukprot:817008-Alexandrium_andersonii.AAC.1
MSKSGHAEAGKHAPNWRRHAKRGPCALHTRGGHVQWVCAGTHVHADQVRRQGRRTTYARERAA